MSMGDGDGEKCKYHIHIFQNIETCSYESIKTEKQETKTERNTHKKKKKNEWNK